ncbi:MAG: hypothetical protein HYT73_01660 [Candidatus Aenigmarchaeota archaeon]|nr:hypothetical protein [Candidatus Aenigmarchaeota archaeon]
MALEDIGQVLFVDILKMSQYPGSPFTGNIFNDLVMFFFIPTVFIILVVYMMVARVLPADYKGLRFLLGIAAYLFIIVGGYYSLFAYLAGPYFLFLILFMGLLFYFTRHFQRTGGAPALHGSATRGGVNETGADSRVHQLIDAEIEAEELETQIKEAKHLANPQNVPQMQTRLSELKSTIRRLKPSVQRNPLESIQYQNLRHKHHLR